MAKGKVLTNEFKIIEIRASSKVAAKNVAASTNVSYWVLNVEKLGVGHYSVTMMPKFQGL